MTAVRMASHLMAGIWPATPTPPHEQNLKWIHAQLKQNSFKQFKHHTNRDVTRTLIGGGGEYSYIHVLPDEFLFKLINLNLI